MEPTTTIRSHAAFGAACAVCCGVPMLVVLGVVSLGAALLGGVAVAAVLGLSGLCYILIRRRLGPFPPAVSRGLGVIGIGLGGVGLWLAGSSQPAAPKVLILALAVLGAALLVLADTRNEHA